jgi:signal transduction histidine kinase
MINDLLDLAKIEAGKAVVRFDKVSVTDTCQTLLALMKPLADKKQIDLRGELGDDVPLIVTDASKVQQILFNLLSNAIKFTPVAGKVTLQARKEPSRPGSVDEVCICVADTGPGIAEDQQHRIFEKFYQVDRSLTKETSGTGLGLSISKELTNLLGGRLALKSSPGHGAEFTLTLPVEPPAKPEARPPAGKTQDAAGK